MRDFIEKHPAYAHDSHVPHEVVAHLGRKCDALGRGEDAEAARALLGDASKAPRLRVEHAYDKPLSARRVDPSERDDLVSVYVRRAREPLGPSQNLRIAPLLSPPSGTSTASRSRAAATARSTTSTR